MADTVCYCISKGDERMKLFDKMKTNEREMILSMLANNAERNIELLVLESIDRDWETQ